MREQIQSRLEELQKEFASGQAALQDLEARQAGLRATLLQITGAITVLQQLLEQVEPEGEKETARPEKSKATSKAA